MSKKPKTIIKKAPKSTNVQTSTSSLSGLTTTETSINTKLQSIPETKKFVSQQTKLAIVDDGLSEDEPVTPTTQDTETETEPETQDDVLGDNVDYGGKSKDDETETGAEMEEEDEDETETGSDDDTDKTTEYEQEKTDDDDTCLYNFADKLKQDDDDDDFDDEEIYDDDEKDKTVAKQKSKYVTQKDRITKPYLTKYERVRILGSRSRQLLLGAKPMLKNTENLAPREIAQLELIHGMIPYKIQRVMPNGDIEEISVKDLQIVN